MTSRIGSNSRILQRPALGFTLIEAMAAAAVLSLGIVLIYGALFISLDAFNYYSDYMELVSWVDNQVWVAGDNITRFGTLAGITTYGSFAIDNRNFNWSLTYSPKAGMYKLFEVNMMLSGSRGKRPVVISRTTYARYTERQ